MAVYNIKILGSDGTSISQPIGSSSEHVLIQNEGTTTLTTKLQSIATSISNLNSALNGKADATVATTSSNGLMSSTDKAKLDTLKNYTLPTASNTTLGGVKTTSSVTSTSGLTACPIIGGVVYYKDTNNTYTLGSFGITASADELNYVDGVTSNIQTQLNGKAPSVHNQSVSTLTSGTFSTTDIVAAIGDDTKYRIRNLMFTNSDPGAGVANTNNGSLICVYE